MSAQPDPIVLAVHDADCGCSSLVHPEPERWDYYARIADAVRARLHTEHVWCLDGTPDDGVPVVGPLDRLRSLAESAGGQVFVREVTDWRPEVES